MRIRVTLEADVDDDAWAVAYGLSPAEVEADVAGHLPSAMADSAEEFASRERLYSVRLRSHEVVIPVGGVM
jgi:hypothetical protein